MVAIAVSAGIAAVGLVLGEADRQAQLKSQVNKLRMDSISLKAQANENLRRERTNLLTTGKEFRNRVSSIQSGTAGAGIDISSSGDLIMSEAGALLDQANIQSEESTYAHLTSMHSARNMDEQANNLTAQKNKVFGIF